MPGVWRNNSTGPAGERGSVSDKNTISADPPWSRYAWTGSIIAIASGVDTSDPWPTRFDAVPPNVARIVECGSTTRDSWDGTCYGVVELTDGRFVSWVSTWDATGSGFQCGAYGGDAMIAISADEQSARSFITFEARQACKGEP